MLAQAATPLAFTAGWVRVTLTPCEGARPGAAASRLLVESDRELVLSPGRPGGATLALLSGTSAPAHADQVFPLPSPAAGAREVVLAPWSGPQPPPRVTALRLLAGP